LFTCSLLELPNKTELICTVLGVLNVGNRSLVRLCLDSVNQHLASANVKWWHIVQIPRVMVELTNTRVIPIDVLDNFLLSTCKELIGKSEAGELVATAVLLALPWLSTEFVAGLASLGQVMALLDGLVNAEDRYSLIFKGVDVKVSGFEAFEGDSLKALYGSIRSNSGVVVVEGRLEPYKTFEGALSSSLGHSDFVIEWSVECLETLPTIAEFKPLELFPDAFEGDVSAVAYSKIYYQFMLHQLVEAYELNHRRGAEVLFSCLPEAAMCEKLVCQVLFGKLLRSRVRTSVTYYEVLLIDCCQLSRLFPPMMARSLIKLVAQMSETDADLEVLERLAGWFAHHLSHYDFKWNWTEWKEISEGESESFSCKRIFLRLLINRLLLLSYQEKMQAVIPDFMLKMMPSLSAAPKLPSNLNSELLDFIKQKRPSVEDIREHAAREGNSIFELFQVFLVIGSKTFSHLSSASDRYAGLFQNLSVSDQSSLISLVSEFWADNLQNFHLVLEKLIQYQVVSVPVVLDWIFERVGKAEDFEVSVLLKYLQSDFLMDSLVPSGSSEKVQYMGSVIDRLANVELEGSSALKWLSEGLIRKILRSFFAHKSRFLFLKKDVLTAMLSSTDSSYSENVKIMLESTLKSISI
jgi:hypothetical protein